MGLDSPGISAFKKMAHKHVQSSRSTIGLGYV